MDMFTINQVAIIRHQEFLRQAEQERAAQNAESQGGGGGLPVRKLLHPVGVLLVAAGQRLINSAQPAPQFMTNEGFDTCDQAC